MTGSTLQMIAQVDQSRALIRQIVTENYIALADFAIDGKMDERSLLKLRAIMSATLAIYHAEQYIENQEQAQ